MEEQDRSMDWAECASALSIDYTFRDLAITRFPSFYFLRTFTPCMTHHALNPSLLLLRLLVFTQRLCPLGRNTFLSPLTSSLGLVAFGLHFLLQDTLTLLLGLGFVNL